MTPGSRGAVAPDHREDVSSFVGFQKRGTWTWRLASYRWADCVDGDNRIHCTLSLLPARSHTHSVSFFDIQESSDRNLTIPIMVGWQHDIAEGWVERQSMEMQMYRRLVKTFSLLMYSSSFLYRFSNPVTLTVICGVWYLIQAITNSLPGSDCGPSKTGPSICQGRASVNQHQTSHSFDAKAAVRGGTVQAQSRCQLLLLFYHQHHHLPSLTQIETVYPGKKEPDNATSDHNHIRTNTRVLKESNRGLINWLRR